MKNIFILIIACFLFCACGSHIVPTSTPITNQLTKDSKGTPMLLGHCSPTMLSGTPFNKWFYSAYKAYKPDAESIEKLRPVLSNTTIEIFMGTWCGDSRREVPRLLKTLAATGFDTSNIKLVMVDHEANAYKQSPQHEEQNKYVFRVPTAIVYQHNKEKGRVIESPIESWEKDLTKIVISENYTPTYPGANSYLKEYAYKKLSDKKLEAVAEQYKTTITNSSFLNAMGYVLMGEKQHDLALQAFKVNTLLFPRDSNTWDSFAEAYLNLGNKPKAIEMYKKVLELKPNDSNALEQLKKL